MGRILARITVLAAACALVAGAATAGATSRVTAGSAARARASLAAAGVCHKVPAAAVSAVVHWKVPAPTLSRTDIAGSASDGGISTVETTCTYGQEASIADLPKLVILVSATTSEPITAAELQQLVQQALSKQGQGAAITFKPYNGLGVPAWYLTFGNSIFQVQEVVGFQGTRWFGGAVFSKTLSAARVGALAKLAERL
jgi:hypothetical protein